MFSHIDCCHLFVLGGIGTVLVTFVGSNDFRSEVFTSFLYFLREGDPDTRKN